MTSHMRLLGTHGLPVAVLNSPQGELWSFRGWHSRRRFGCSRICKFTVVSVLEVQPLLFLLAHVKPATVSAHSFPVDDSIHPKTGKLSALLRVILIHFDESVIERERKMNQG